jgi:cellulose synthase/poly-beta-1,6-N-acetylglucosamine synthase-like glycosyltransferase
METAAIVVFWTCGALVVYSYVFYPLVLMAVASRRRALIVPDPARDVDLPLVSVLIAAHNEEPVIRSRIENLLALDYPSDKLDLVIASDASGDGTVRIVREYEDRRVRLVEFTARTGKAAVLNATIPTLKGEIVVLSDANTMMDRSAVRNLVRWFRDAHVGVVCGKLVLTDPTTGRNVDGLYWRYETLLKRCEGKIGGLLGANGGIYAIRRALFQGIPSDTIVDDFVTPLLAHVRTGCAMVYDETAIAHEETPAEITAEFRRRARIGAGGFQSLAVLWPLLDPRRGAIAFTFVSHKLLRWLCPFFLIGLAVANAMLVNVGFYGVSLIAGLVLCGVAVAGQLLPAKSAVGKVMRLATMFGTMNAALLVGFFRWAVGSQRAAWDRTVR